MDVKTNGSSKGISFDNPDVESFLDSLFQLIKEEALKKGTSRETAVIEFKQPHELEVLFDFEIHHKPSSHESLLEEVKKIIKYSVKSGHPHFHNLLYAGLDPYSLSGAWLTDALNANIHTFEASPVFIMMEKYMFKKLSTLIGYTNGDGLFCPGGSASNFLALHLARYRKFPQVKQTGVYNFPQMRCYVSEDGHYSLKKAGHFLGLGEDNIVPIKTDKLGIMLPSDLKIKVQEDLDKGYVPLFVMATGGSTVLGAFDPIPELHAICQEFNMWLHCDACLGAGVLLSKKHKYLLDGIDSCDSVAWNFHKISGVPLQCSAFLLNDKDLLGEANGSKAEYLFQPDKYYDTSLDIGDRSVQCGRKVDIVKLWMMWKALGDDGMGSRIDQAFDNASYLKKKMEVSNNFRLVIPEFQCTNVCFWYLPARFLGQKETEDWWAELHKVAPKIKEAMVKCGSMMISYQPLSSKGFVNFFRMVVHNPLCTYSDMDFVISEVDRLGHHL
ncbi:cysteine sulfinic acid decarboxylase-like [Physella acuta]|uniref:cysteine sulfinic acid decarboxylase-like n=1 Tax=Physella acuta TaxID=109671 RepID=UPI0027DE4557|nr:cysteine sulfinic acid decarboxylase-like [Physella acuta]